MVGTRARTGAREVACHVADREPWRTLLARNSPGTLPPRIPIFLAQGSTDNPVLPRVTEDDRSRLCRAGSRVAFDRVPGVGHLSIAKDAAPAALDWIGDRFAGVPAPSHCGEP